MNDILAHDFEPFPQPWQPVERSVTYSVKRPEKWPPCRICGRESVFVGPFRLCDECYALADQISRDRAAHALLNKIGYALFADRYYREGAAPPASE